MVAVRSAFVVAALLPYATVYGIDIVADGAVGNIKPREITVTVTETMCPAAPQYPPASTTATFPFPETPIYGTTPGYDTIPGYGTTPVETPGVPSTSVVVPSTSSNEMTIPAVPPTTVASDKPPTQSTATNTETYPTTSKASTTATHPVTSVMTPTHSSVVPTTPTATPTSTLPASGAQSESFNFGLMGLVVLAILI